MTPYFNTNHLSGPDLKEAVRRAKCQDEAILLIYKNTRQAWSPSQIQGMCERAGWRWAVTSIRRSISNLTKWGDLVKTSEMHVGPYKSMEHLWKINSVKHP